MLSGLPLVLVAVLFGAMVVGALLDGGGNPVLMVLMVPIIALLLWAAVRSFGLELLLTDDARTVRGLARTRTVPRFAIEAVLPSATAGAAAAAVLFKVSEDQLPTVQTYRTVCLFADVSGFTTLSEALCSFSASTCFSSSCC